MMDGAEPHTHERVVLGAVILGGIAALVFGFSYIGKSIEKPLILQQKTLKTPYEKEIETNAELRTKDTDGDGLTDYDEQYVWNTSAYLADSDSDGINDKTEVETGNNPNCPTGQNCGAAAVTSEDAAGKNPIDITEGLQPSEGLLVNPQGDLGDLLRGLPPSEIRTVLEDYGVPKAQLDALTDEQLLQLYNYSIAESVRKIEEGEVVIPDTETESGQ